MFAPSKSILNEYKYDPVFKGNQDRYTARFRLEVMDQLDPKDALATLQGFHVPYMVLLCYEKPGSFCHRHLVAAWLNLHLSLDVQEF